MPQQHITIMDTREAQGSIVIITVIGVATVDVTATCPLLIIELFSILLSEAKEKKENNFTPLRIQILLLNLLR